MICKVCKNEILDEINVVKVESILVHRECETFVKYYENKPSRDFVRCCGREWSVDVGVNNGYVKGVGQCDICKKVYVTDRWPKIPKPHNPKPPKRGIQ